MRASVLFLSILSMMFVLLASGPVCQSMVQAGQKKQLMTMVLLSLLNRRKKIIIPVPVPIPVEKGNKCCPPLPISPPSQPTVAKEYIPVMVKLDHADLKKCEKDHSQSDAYAYDSVNVNGGSSHNGQLNNYNGY